MVKRFQNMIAESRLTLPAMVVYALGVWLLAGLIGQQWWLQLGCFAVATYLMVELNNQHALIRIYSRMVSCTFLALSCTACFLFPSLSGAIMQVGLIGTLMLLFMTYQDQQAAGLSYYAFLCLGLASVAFPQLVYYVPLLWILMASQLQSLSWRTWGATVFGLLTPYWFWGCWLGWHGDYTPMVSHWLQVARFQPLFHFSAVGYPRLAVAVLTMLFALTGTVHYIRQHHNDKIRIRQLYGFLIYMNSATVLFLLLQPQHFDNLLRIMTVVTAPIAAHFFALTSTKYTNVAFCAAMAVVLLLTALNLWIFSSVF